MSSTSANLKAKILKDGAKEEVSDADSQRSNKADLKEFLEARMPIKKRREESKNTHYAIETVGQIDPESPDYCKGSMDMNNDSVGGGTYRKIRNQSQKVNYNTKTEREETISNRNNSRLLNPSSNANPETQVKHYVKTGSSDTTERKYKEKGGKPKCFTKVSYLKKNISFDD